MFKVNTYSKFASTEIFNILFFNALLSKLNLSTGNIVEVREERGREGGRVLLEVGARWEVGLHSKQRVKVYRWAVICLSTAIAPAFLSCASI